MPKIFGILRKPPFFVFLAFVFYLVWGISTLQNFITADEHFWLPNYGSERIQAFWHAVSEGEWENTRVNDKPGVTLAYFSGVALPFTGKLIENHLIEETPSYKVYDPEITRQLNFAFRLPLFLLNGALICFFYLLIRKLAGNGWVAAWSAIFMLLSPVLLGMNQIVNPDTLFWSFGVGVILSFSVYLRERDPRYAWLAGLFFGLTLASKYVGVIMIPFLMALVFLDYVFRYETYHENGLRLRERIKLDLAAYWGVVAGGSALLALLMPAALVDPVVLYESTIGFPGMLPVFVGLIALHALIVADMLFFESVSARFLAGLIYRYRSVFEKALYALLLLTTVFVLFNWTFQNSLYDLTNIPFDAKTKDSFTTKNTYLERYIVEFVALTFSLTPLTLFALFFGWIYGIFAGFKRRLLPMSISTFILIFYLAVIEQGLLVTTRYSIILFPLALILAALGVRAFFYGELTAGKKRALGVFSFLMGLYASAYGFMVYYQHLTQKEALNLKYMLNTQMGINIAIFLGAGLILGVLLYGLSRLILRYRVSPVTISLVLIVGSLIPLARAHPHFFVYTNELLPKNYITFLNWGYGGYEAAEYLNSKPNARELFAWSDVHGFCEFFVGRCSRASNLDATVYHVDYFYRTYKGALRPKFPYNTDEAEWSYVINGRKKNFLRLYPNAPLQAERMEEEIDEKLEKELKDRLEDAGKKAAPRLDTEALEEPEIIE